MEMSHMYQQPIAKESFQSCGKGRHTAYSSRDHEYAFLSCNNGSFLIAGKNIDIGTVAKEKHVAVAYGDSSAEIHSVQNQQSLLAGENVTLKAGEDVNLRGALTSASNDTNITAGRNVNMTAVKDLYSEESEVGHRGGNYYNHNKQVDETVKGTTVAGKENAAVTAGEDILVKGSSISTEKGKVTLNAGKDISIENETERHERLHEFHEKVSGILSTKTTDIYDARSIDQVVGSSISGGSVDLTSKKDTTVRGSTVIGDGDVHIQTGGNFTAESADEVSQSEYMKQVKKSGLLAGSGLGITIGKEKQKDQYASQNIEQVESTIGSVGGSVTISSDKDAAVKASDVIAGKDIHITGENVDITSKDSTYNYQEKHEYERSGLSISVGGGVVDVVTNVIADVHRGAEVRDEKLKALYGVQTYQTIMENKDVIQNPSGKGMPGINVGLGSSSYQAETKTEIVQAKESTVTARGDVHVKAKDDIAIHGSDVSGKNVTLEAGKNLQLTAAEETSSNYTKQQGKSGSVGVTFSPTGNSVYAGSSKGQAQEKEDVIFHKRSHVTADKELTMESGKDTRISGSQVSGDKVTIRTGGDLQIESVQDKNTYTEETQNKGIGIGINTSGIAAGNAELNGGKNKGNIDSNYQSITEQAGIYAGKEGFDINVEKNTDLKGAVIDSRAPEEKNQLTTGTLTWEDTQNKAEYEAGSKGINVDTNKGTPIKDSGITPSIGIGAEGTAESITKSGIAEGEIVVRDKEHQKQDIRELNRETKNKLNQLGEIFDKTKIEERQELAGLFGELAFNRIHELNGTVEQKAAYHALVASIMAKLTGGDMLSSAGSAAINKMVVNEIYKIAGKDPALAQWLSAALGYAITGKASGASINANATKNNMFHMLFKNIIKGIDPDSLELNTAYAISLDGSIQYGGVMAGCYIARDPNDLNDLIIFDTMGGQVQVSLGGLSAGMTITKVTFDKEVNAADAIAGWAVSGGITANNVQISAGIPIKDFLDSIWDGQFHGENSYVEKGVSTEQQLAIAAGLSYAWEVGKRSDNNIWPIDESTYLNGIMTYKKEHPDEKFTIYYDKNLNVTREIRKGYLGIGYEQLANLGNHMEWIPIKSNSIPSEKDLLILEVHGDD